jgi:ANTAR domain-containing protein
MELTRTPPSPTATSTTDGTHSCHGEFPETYQAAGMVMVQLDVDITTAATLLRSYAVATHRPLVDVARDIVVHRLRLNELPT